MNIQDNKTETRPAQIVVRSTKNVGLAVVLSALFGPLGMFYSTIMGGIIMCFVYGLVWLLTLGFGVILVHPICMIWGGLAAKSYNDNLLKQSSSI